MPRGVRDRIDDGRQVQRVENGQATRVLQGRRVECVLAYRVDVEAGDRVEHDPQGSRDTRRRRRLGAARHDERGRRVTGHGHPDQVDAFDLRALCTVQRDLVAALG